MRIGIVAAVALWPATSLASSLSGQGLLSYCSMQNVGNVICATYVAGVSDALFELSRQTKPFCEPDDISGDTIVAITNRFLSANSARLNLPAPTLLREMLISTFPCPKN